MLALIVGLLLVAAVLYVGLKYLQHKLPASPSPAFFENILIGHRGCRHPSFPCQENSMESMRYAIAKGVDGIEFDLMLTKDGIPVVFHDTNRMTRVCKPRGPQGQSHEDADTKCVGEMTLEEVKQYRYNQGPETAVIPTLEELLEDSLKLNPKIKMMIETKEIKGALKMAEHLVRVFKKHNLYDQAVVGSFNPMALYHVRRIEPKIVTLLLVKKGLLNDFASDEHCKDAALDRGFVKALLVAKKCKLLGILDYLLYQSLLTWVPAFLGAGVLGFHGVLLEAGDIDAKDFQNSGYAINVWTVNNPEFKKTLLQNGKIAITTDVLFDRP